MPTSYVYQGRKTVLPGVYPTVDTRALAGTSAQSTGIVAIIGTSLGGRPYTAIADRTDMQGYQSPTAMQRDYPAGDLIEAANMLFSPSKDESIPGGAQSVVPIKVNPAFQAKVTLNGPSAASLVVSSLAYGVGGNGIAISVGQGSTSGVKVSISQANVSEVGDNLGDDPVGSLTYDASGSWKRLTFTKATDLTLSGQTPLPARASEVTTTAVPQGATVAVSSQTGDKGKTLTIYGADAAGLPIIEKVILTGAAQSTTQAYAAVLGGALSDAALDVKVQAGSTLFFELANNAQAAGICELGSLAVGNTTVTLAAAGQSKVLLLGLDAAGNALSEVITVGANGSTAGTKAFAAITRAVAGALAQDGTLSATVAFLPGSANLSLQQVKGALATVKGLDVAITDGDADTPIDAIDPVPATNLADGPVKLVSDLEAVIDWINGNSQLVTAKAAPGAVSLPSTTQAPVLLSGGSESKATYADWQAALRLLQQVRVNTVVCLTSDPAINQLVDQHCVKMGGKGASERDGIIGILSPDQTRLPTKAEVLRALATYNSRHLRAAFQSPVRYDTFGNATTFGPHFYAAIAAGMQAGSPLGQSLTERTSDVITVKTHPSIDLLDDEEDIVAAGGLLFRQEDGIGVICRRNVTTYTSDDNPAKSEASVNQILNYVVYDLRLYIRAYLGKPNVAGTLTSIKAGLNGRLTQYMDRQIIQGFKTPVLTPLVDVVNVALQIAPVFPQNFFPLNISVVQSIDAQAA